MPSPLYPQHAKLHSEVIAWLVGYKAATPGVEVLDNATIYLADDGEPQPDACLVIPEELGGQTREEEAIVGAPELVVEIARSSQAYDLYNKKADYERAGVREYVVVVVHEPHVRWFVRRGDGPSGWRFTEREAGPDGLFRSEVYPGLWLDADALLRRDSRGVRAALDAGAETAAHVEFARALHR